VKKQTSLQEILDAVSQERCPTLEHAFMLDFFESEKLGHDRKNVTLRFCYRDKEKTLSYESVEADHAKLTQKVAEKLRDCLL
jgi:phenylalanyl-tRNA synthetase beta subunit